MTKIYPIISLSGEMYMIEKTKDIKVGDFFSNPITKTVHCLTELSDGDRMGIWIKVLAGPKELGLPLLPSIEEDIEQLALRAYPQLEQVQKQSEKDIEKQISKRIGFITGYRAASKKQYTEEDMYKAMNFALNKKELGNKRFPILNWPENEEEAEKLNEEAKKRLDIVNQEVKQFFQSLKPIPTAIEVETDEEVWTGQGSEIVENKNFGKLLVDKQGYIIVKRWIYEKQV